jgi:hypothetical protein
MSCKPVPPWRQVIHETVGVLYSHTSPDTHLSRRRCNPRRSLLDTAVSSGSPNRFSHPQLAHLHTAECRKQILSAKEVNYYIVLHVITLYKYFFRDNNDEDAVRKLRVRTCRVDHSALITQEARIKPIWFLREERSDEWSAGMNGHI